MTGGRGGRSQQLLLREAYDRSSFCLYTTATCLLIFFTWHGFIMNTTADLLLTVDACMRRFNKEEDVNLARR